jgi:CxxC-x17-CxxC domain-containing protein
LQFEDKQQQPLEDKKFTCATCAREFTFSIGEQEFSSERKLTNKPKRCQKCTLEARLKQKGIKKEVFEIECARCKAVTAVAYEPTDAKPVYCESCVHKRMTP